MNLPGGWVDAYLARLGLADAGPVSIASLTTLHRAHVERIPYETFGIALSQPFGVRPSESVPRLLAGWGGYCFHLNGAFHSLLTELGYDARLHRGGVQGGREEAAPGADGNHAGMTVLLDGDLWFVDVGLGNALHEPTPLAAGPIRDPLLNLVMTPSAVVPGGWRLDHDERLLSFRGMDMAAEVVELDTFSLNHERLSTSPDSPFVRTVSAHRRDATSVTSVKGPVVMRFVGGVRDETVISSGSEWWDLLAEEFGLPVSEVSADAREGLWSKVIRDYRESGS